MADTSASRGLGFAGETLTIQQLIDVCAHAYGDTLPVQVVAFAQVRCSPASAPHVERECFEDLYVVSS
jgi:hypothetical protein